MSMPAASWVGFHASRQKMRSRQRRPAGGWEEEPAVGAAEVDLGFQEPGEGRGDRDYAAGVLLAVVGLGSLEDAALVGGATNLEGLAVEVFGAEREHLA